MARTLKFLWILWLTALAWTLCRPVHAHDIPASHLALRLGSSAVTAEVRLPWTGVTAELPVLGPVAPSAPGDGAGRVAENRDALARIVTERLGLTADNRLLTGPEIGEVVLSEDRTHVQLEVTYPYRDASGNAVPPPQVLGVTCRFFPTDPRHKTLLRIYRGAGQGQLEREEFLTFENASVTHTVGGGASIPAIVGQFVREGIHHIFIGPDHILFVIGLLLAGGSVRYIFKIVTAFTLAHSLTLAVAALGWWTPPSKFVESVIALSIIFVGLDVLLRRPVVPKAPEENPQEDGDSISAPKASADRRVWYAFIFGLIHGFGFASVMGELDLPRYALGWTLVSFNVGVEIGQACIILLALPVLRFLARWNPRIGRLVVLGGAAGVTAAGAYWFIERILA